MSNWTPQWFGHKAYEWVYRHRDEREASRLADLIEQVARPEPGSHLLDVACGRGRHARVFARRGYRVTGVDINPDVLEEARRRSQREGLSITFLQADMRKLPFDATFDGVLNLFTSFGYFDTDEEHLQAIQSMSRALKPGGWLVQDFLNAPYVRRNLVPRDERTYGNVHILQERYISGIFLFKRITLQQEGKTYTFVERVRLLERKDFEAMYKQAGLVLQSCLGDYEGTPWSPDIPRLILYARRHA